MPEDKVLEMRKQVIDYYESYLSMGAVKRKVDQAGPEVTIFFPFESNLSALQRLDYESVLFAAPSLF
jgi:hypothetical protein